MTLSRTPAPENFEAYRAIHTAFERHQNCQLALCDALENIADDLPDGVNVKTCLHIADTIQSVVKSAQDFEQSTLFPLLQKEHEDKMIARLQREHFEDEGFSFEVSEALNAFIEGREHNIEKLAYMLRGFFEGLRRHIAFEREVITPLLLSAPSN